MEPITTIRERCRECYSCIRNCPVKAIKMVDNCAEIINERCIGCGKCIKLCSQSAKQITDCIEKARRLLHDSVDVVAVLGCSFPAFFHDIKPGQLVTGIRRLGFAEVHEGAFGVDLVNGPYTDIINQSGSAPILSSHCPTVVDLVERHAPQLLRNLAKIVSPMIAIGRFIKAQRSAKTKVIYISACIAGKFEINAEPVAGAVDIVLTYQELRQMFNNEGIDLTRLPSTPFNGLPAKAGRTFAISGGPFQAFDVRNDHFTPDFISIEGEDGTIEIIKDLAAGRVKPRYVDIRFCSGGCISGPGRNNRLTTFSKRSHILDFVANGKAPFSTDRCYQQPPPGLDLSRRFSNKCKRLETPGGEVIRRILEKTRKFVQSDELDCGACGYATCREYAVAVYQGLAEHAMCLPYLIKNLSEDSIKLAQKYELAQRALEDKFGDENIVGNDQRTIETQNLISQVGPTPTTVLIRGESGTGKELTARAIHRQSLRADKPLVTVNCTTLSDNLLESELFGYKKGAFTGAGSDKKGLFEAANGGTIFLDEIGDISPKVQAELLRVIDSGEIRPVGDNRTLEVDVRLIAATNKNLENGVREGWFREDLFYRLNVFTITMPPLRNRIESLEKLVHHFLKRASKRLNKEIAGIDERAIQAMFRYPWPGNIRELQNIIERAAVLTQDNIIRLENLPVALAELIRTAERSDEYSDLRDQVKDRAGQAETELLKRCLLESGGNVTNAAQRASIPRRSFYRMLQRSGINSADFRTKNP
ncbi:MAG: sigma 54-interacting transcriptional regulator [Desulfuromonadales bacterium]|nr:sigma 54-interacting transcriptional regulator [Desulfuromonadales bacterium]